MTSDQKKKVQHMVCKKKLCTQHVLSLYYSCNSMKNLLSYHWLINARMRASDKDLPVIQENPTQMCQECDLIGSTSDNLTHADWFQKPSNLSALKKYLEPANFQVTTGEF